MRVLVTGVGGFIGSTLAERLIDQGHDVVGIEAFLSDLYPASVKRRNVNDRLANDAAFRLIEGDIRTLDLSASLDGVDAVINEAAMPGLSKSWEKLDLYFTCNVVGLGRLLEAARRARVHKFIQISTSSVYGTSAVGDESVPTAPTSPYGVSKLAAENLVAAYTGISDFDAIILRYFSVYGPRQRPDMAYHIFIERLLEDRPIVVFGDGRQSRSNTYVTDCVEGTIRALSSPVSSGVFNIAGGERITLLEAIQILADELGVEPRLEFVDPRPGDQRTTAGDWSAAHKAFGYQPTSSLEHGLREQAKWHLGQRSGVIGSR